MGGWMNERGTLFLSKSLNSDPEAILSMHKRSELNVYCIGQENHHEKSRCIW
jgi:hypothetical protein